MKMKNERKSKETAKTEVNAKIIGFCDTLGWNGAGMRGGQGGRFPFLSMTLKLYVYVCIKLMLKISMNC